MFSRLEAIELQAAVIESSKCAAKHASELSTTFLRLLLPAAQRVRTFHACVVQKNVFINAVQDSDKMKATKLHLVLCAIPLDHDFHFMLRNQSHFQIRISRYAAITLVKFSHLILNRYSIRSQQFPFHESSLIPCFPGPGNVSCVLC